MHNSNCPLHSQFQTYWRSYFTGCSCITAFFFFFPLVLSAPKEVKHLTKSNNLSPNRTVKQKLKTTVDKINNGEAHTSALQVFSQLYLWLCFLQKGQPYFSLSLQLHAAITIFMIAKLFLCLPGKPNERTQLTVNLTR